jgi:hypothetical protein
MWCCLVKSAHSKGKATPTKNLPPVVAAGTVSAQVRRLSEKIDASTKQTPPVERKPAAKRGSVADVVEQKVISPGTKLFVDRYVINDGERTFSDGSAYLLLAKDARSYAAVLLRFYADAEIVRGCQPHLCFFSLAPLPGSVVLIRLPGNTDFSWSSAVRP